MTAFPALPIVYGMRRTFKVDVRQQRRLDLKLERMSFNRHVQHSFEIPWQNLSPAERTTLDTFFQSVRGKSLGDIAFTDPWDSVTYTCRLGQDELNFEEVSARRWSATITLVEVSAFKAAKAAV